MRIGMLTLLAFYTNSAMDSGRYDDISYDEVANHIEGGTIFSFLRERLKRDIDLSIYEPEDEAELIAEWQDMLAAISARRKFGIEKRGLPLLNAYLIEGIQRRAA